MLISLDLGILYFFVYPGIYMWIFLGGRLMVHLKERKEK